MKKEHNLPKKVKGAVLYTVVSVMLIMIVFVMATMAIVSAANKRAHNTYFKNQAYYSARSVVDSATKSVLDDTSVNSIASALTTLNNSNKGPITIEVVGYDGSGNIIQGSLPSGMGTLKSFTAEYAATDTNDPTDPEAVFVSGTGKDIIKISATVEMGGQESTYSEYLLKSPPETATVIPEGGLVSFGGLSTSQTNPGVLGTQLILNGDDPDSNTWELLSNEASSSSPHFSHNAYFNTSATFNMPAGGSVFIAGSLAYQNIPVFNNIITSGTTVKYGKLPYVYVGRVFFTSESPVTVGSQSNPVNIFCGQITGNCRNWDNTFKAKGAFGNFNSDIYAYTAYTGIPKKLINGFQEYWYEEGLSVLGNGGSGTHLVQWVTTLIDGTDTTFANYTGGNFFSKGGLQLVGDAQTTINGDTVLYGPFFGTLGNGGAQINGSLVVKGDKFELSNSNNSNLQVQGGVFFDPTATTVNITPGAFINGVPYTDGSYVDYIKTVNTVVGITDQVTIKNSGVTYKLSDYGGDYAQFMKAVANGTSFPADYETGNPNIVTTAQQIANYKDVPSGEYIDTIYKSDPVDTSCYDTVYTQSNIPAEITTSCTLKGDFNGKTIIINPGSNSLWVALANVKFNNCKVIVNNVTNTGVLLTGKVNFFVPAKETNRLIGSGSTVEYINLTGDFAMENTKIMTSFYNSVATYDTDGTLDILRYPKVNGDKRQIPNIYFYMAEKGTPSDDGSGNTIYTGGGKFTATNQCMFIGYLMAPYSTFSWSNTSGLSYGGSVKWRNDANSEAASLTPGKISVIGSVIVADIASMQNDFQLVQVSPNIPAGSVISGGSSSGGSWSQITNCAAFGD